MRRGLIEGGFESTAVKSGAINQLEGLLSKLLFVLQTRGMGYRCILSRQSSTHSCLASVKPIKGLKQPAQGTGLHPAGLDAFIEWRSGHRIDVRKLHITNTYHMLWEKVHPIKLDNKSDIVCPLTAPFAAAKKL